MVVEDRLAEYRIIYCSDKITLRKVTQLHTERLRLVTIKLMCDNHPAGPVEIPDPALFYDPKVGCRVELFRLLGGRMLYRDHRDK